MPDSRKIASPVAQNRNSERLIAPRPTHPARYSRPQGTDGDQFDQQANAVKNASCPRRRSLSLGCPLLFDVLHVTLKEISQLLDGRTERNPEAEFGEIACGPRPFLQDVHGSLHHLCINENHTENGHGDFPPSNGARSFFLLYATSQDIVLLLRAKRLFAEAI